MKCIVNGRIITNHKEYIGQVICFDEQIKYIGDYEAAVKKYGDMEIIDAEGKIVSPGFIDIHIHGSMGHDVCDGKIEDLQVISKAIAKNGVTSFLPTTMTLPKDELGEILKVIGIAKELDMEGASVLGAHLEGPFINKALKGAQKGDHITIPDYGFVEEHKDTIALITLAPEVEGAVDFIKQVKQNTSIILSMGHTNATYEEAMAGIEAGVSQATHTFNAMSKLHHREPGTVGASLMSDDVTCEVIADNVHMHPAIYKMILKMKGLNKIILVTDCVQATGLADGQYMLGGQKIYVKDGKSLLECGTIAGSVLRLNEGVKNFKESVELHISDVIAFVTENPAMNLGVYDRKGSIEEGKDADLVLLSDDLEVELTIREGKVIYEK